MNNEQNNNVIGGMSFIPPTTGDNTSTNTNNLNATPSANDSIPGANLSPIGSGTPMMDSAPNPNPTGTNSIIQPNIISAPSSGTVEASSAMSSNPTQDNQGLLNPNLNTIIPESSNNSSNTNSGLNFNSSSPFDIGMTPSNNMENTTIMPNPLGNNQSPSVTENNNMGANTTINNSTTSAPLTNSSPSNGQSNNSDNIVSVGKYLGHILLFSIPLIGTVMLIVKAFFDKKDKNISNLAKAQLLLAVIILVISFVIGIVFGVLITNTIPSSTITTYGV